MKKYALIIGNSDGIGLGLTRILISKGWKVIGVSRSPSPISDKNYVHNVKDVQQDDFISVIQDIVEQYPAPDLCVYCAGTGELLDFSDMSGEVNIMEINLMGMIRFASIVIPKMVEQKTGHLIGLSSVADAMLSGEAPSYHASKSGFSTYLESLALATRSQGIHVSNIRFGFVDTKMAKGERKPMMMTVGKAVDHILYCIDKKPVRMTRPRIVIPLVGFRNLMLRLKNIG